MKLARTPSYGSRQILKIQADMLAQSVWLVRRARGGQCLRSYAAAASNLQLIKAQREKSGAPMSEVKAALEEASWDEGMQLVLSL